MKSDVNDSVPKALRNWFIFHFAADMIFAIPMFFVPVAFLTKLRLKIIWSTAAIIGLFIGLISNHFSNYVFGFALLFIFVLFNILWIFCHMKPRLGNR